MGCKESRLQLTQIVREKEKLEDSRCLHDLS